MKEVIANLIIGTCFPRDGFHRYSWTMWGALPIRLRRWAVVHRTENYSPLSYILDMATWEEMKES